MTVYWTKIVHRKHIPKIKIPESESYLNLYKVTAIYYQETHLEIYNKIRVIWEYYKNNNINYCYLSRNGLNEVIFSTIVKHLWKLQTMEHNTT